MIKDFKVIAVDDDTRIDKWLKRNFSSLSQSFIEKNIRKGLIKINHHKVKASFKVIKNDFVNIYNYSKDSYQNTIKKINHKNIPKDLKSKFTKSIIFENKDFIVINKWSDIATQGESKINISIDDIIKNISQEYNLVHRLDKETSGLLILAKNFLITRLFGKLFREQKIKKIYLAVCQGVPKHMESVVKLKINNKKNPTNISQSITKYKVLKNKNKLSVILFKPLTGKTHQLRIVSKHLGCPIIGDIKYNSLKKYNLEKLKLNAYFLKFFINNRNYEFMSKLPNHFNKFISKNEISTIIDKNISCFLDL